MNYKKIVRSASAITMLALIGVLFAPGLQAHAADWRYQSRYKKYYQLTHKRDSQQATSTPTTPATSTPATPPVVEATSTPVVVGTSTATTTVPTTQTPAPVTSSIGTYGLSQDGTFEETGSMSESKSASWWLNSGAYFTVANGVGKTAQGSLSANDPWRLEYASANPEDTDNGYHPQNIFRLVTTSTWKNVSQQAYFTVNAYNQSSSSNRAEHNGFLFFNRYVDSQNLYYTGLRVDGTAVIKKKINGTYYTLDQQTVYPGTYNRSSNPNLIPTNTEIGMKSVVTDNPNGSVSIKLYVDKNHSGTWTMVSSAIDDGSQYGPVISAKASAGIRTDFMDASFKGYSVTELQ